MASYGSGSLLRSRLLGNRSFRQRVSSPTTSSLILKSIRQRLIEGTINTVNRSLCNYTRNQSDTFTTWLEIWDRFNEVDVGESTSKLVN